MVFVNMIELGGYKLKKLVFLIMCLTLIVLTACFPTGEQKDSSSTVLLNETEGSRPISIDRELEENLYVKGEVNWPEVERFKSRQVSLKMKFDVKKDLGPLLKNKQIKETREVNNGMFKNHKDTFISFADGSYLSIQYGRVRYSDTIFQEREYENVISGSTYFIRPDLREVFKKNELEGLDKNNAIQQVKNALTGLGIDKLGDPDVIALDFETLDSEWEDYETKDGSEPRKFKKEDEAYLVIYPVVSDGIKITTTGYFNPDNQIDAIGSRVMGVVSKDGLLLLQVSGIYDKGDIVNDNINPISLETALKKVKNKYKNIMIEDPILISKISLEYVPIVASTDTIKYVLAPAWVFQGKQDKTMDDKKGGTIQVSDDFTILINAETGEEIRSGGVR
jgi:hypothetical protein